MSYKLKFVGGFPGKVTDRDLDKLKLSDIKPPIANLTSLSFSWYSKHRLLKG